MTWRKKLPMWITLFRILLTPVILATLYPNTLFWNVVSALLFMLASVSDYYDGFFARKFQAVSTMGQFMDPIADKILVTSILVILIPFGKIDPYMVIILLARDTLIGGIRAVAASDRVIIAAKPAGKWKTALQMIAIPAVMIDQRWVGVPFDTIGYYVLWISVILSVVSGVEYYLLFAKSHKRPGSAT